MKKEVKEMIMMMMMMNEKAAKMYLQRNRVLKFNTWV
jgi:hypothetical protein